MDREGESYTMTLYESWMNKAFNKDGKSVEAIWDVYMPREQKVYEQILGQQITKLEGTVTELGQRFSLTAEEVIAFIDGINDALPEPFDMNTLDENSHLVLHIDFERLYKKMVEYKAKHLYSLPQWDAIFSAEKRKELMTQQRKSRTIVKSAKIGRNDPCPCGSGKKYKRCCGANL